MTKARKQPKRDGELRSAKPKAGFALLMTLVLVAFLVLLLVGLATYTRIETTIAGNQQRQAQARENALFALQAALGQLQKHAGPDTRATATGEAAGNAGTKHYTGVWDSTTPGSGPITWLVSGSERAGVTPDDLVAAALDPASNATTDQEFLVGSRTVSANADRIKIAKQEITAPGVPGQTGPVRIGRYAWWVGDQGVKAPVAVADTTDAITFAPYDTADARSRIRQQITLGAGASDTAGEPVFEPADANNASLVANGKISSTPQFSFLRNATNAQLGLARAQQNFHAWSPNNFAVIADTKNGGLRQDLSLAPGLLGSAFSAWANYPGYTEPLSTTTTTTNENGTTTTTTPTEGILPPYGTEPLRRRLVMTPHQLDANASHQIAPILSYFLLTFNVQTESETGSSPVPLQVRARWMVSLWNPYTASLVPENIRVEITGLPSSVQVIPEPSDPPKPPGRAFSLRTPFRRNTADSTAGDITLSLPWNSATLPTDAPMEDRQSWLPGRVYTWRSLENSDKGTSPPDAGFASEFNSRTLSQSGAGVQRSIPGVTATPNDVGHLDVNGSSQLTVTIYAVRESGDVRLGRFTSPEFTPSFTTSPQAIEAKGYQFSYVFRLAESIDTSATPGAWLTTEGRDFRRRSPPAEIFVVEAEGNNPAAYENYATISKPGRLLDRAANAWSYNEDTPVFELPRMPLLSLGALQHLRMVGQRPFMIGNPWGANFTLNEIRLPELFDRFYFSGLVDGVTAGTTATGDLVLPNPLMKPLRKPDSTKVTMDDVRALMTPPTTTDADGNVTPTAAASSRSSKFFLQGGAFNLNSTNQAAWAAVLRGVRFPGPRSFSYLNATEATGTADDASVATVQSGEAQFFRFSHTAQETYKAEPGLSAFGDDSGVTPPNTHLFRRGMRTLTAAQVAAFAGKIVELVRMKHAAIEGTGGPFRSLDEFLSPNPLFAGTGTDADGNTVALAPRSLLEAAIADAGVNSEIAEFSSQWLTQADVMTALAPVLFPRSDTFVIRAYGEAWNPVTATAEGRAWCEATVQRVPDYMVPRSETANGPVGDAPDALPLELTHELNKQLGRRFKVVSFRWLTRSDI